MVVVADQMWLTNKMNVVVVMYLLSHLYQGLTVCLGFSIECNLIGMGILRGLIILVFPIPRTVPSIYRCLVHMQNEWVATWFPLLPVLILLSAGS